MPDGDDNSLIETVHVNSRAVSCDGGDGAAGHPKVYLRIAEADIHCPYCSRHFILKPGAVDSGH